MLNKFFVSVIVGAVIGEYAMYCQWTAVETMLLCVPVGILLGLGMKLLEDKS